jgi:hypothetical protein
VSVVAASLHIALDRCTWRFGVRYRIASPLRNITGNPTVLAMISFDARAAKALREGEHLTFGAAPGVRLVARATRRTWVYRYRSLTDGAMRQVKLGHWPAITGRRRGGAGAPADLRDAGEDISDSRRQERAAARTERELERPTRRAAPYTVRRL